MAASKISTSTNTNRQQSDDNFTLLSYQVGELQKALSRVEAKIDNNSYVHVQNYVADRKDDEATYATKEQIKPIATLFYGIITTIVLGLVGGFITFVIKGGIQ